MDLCTSSSSSSGGLRPANARACKRQLAAAFVGLPERRLNETNRFSHSSRALEPRQKRRRDDRKIRETNATYPCPCPCLLRRRSPLVLVLPLHSALLLAHLRFVCYRQVSDRLHYYLWYWKENVRPTPIVIL